MGLVLAHYVLITTYHLPCHLFLQVGRFDVLFKREELKVHQESHLLRKRLAYTTYGKL